MGRNRVLITRETVDAYLARCTANGSAPRVSELAFELGISRVTLNVRFQELSGVSLSEYFAAHRLEKAAALLSTSDLKNDIVATVAGFGTARTFQRAFARDFGITPARFRKLIRTSVA